MTEDERDISDLLDQAHTFVQNGQNEEAETLLNQLVLKNCKRPHVFHLLGTVYYDQGKFNKAIRAFTRALEIDPGFTDSSIGLSIILNDLGQYPEARKVFEEAKAMLKTKSRQGDDYVNERLAQKHEELGDLYARYERWDEAVREFETAIQLHPEGASVTLKIADALGKQDRVDLAIQKIKKFLFEVPENVQARTLLGKLYYDANQVTEAIAHWEEVLRKDPSNQQVKDYLRLAQAIEIVDLPDHNVVL